LVPKPAAGPRGHRTKKNVLTGMLKFCLGPKNKLVCSCKIFCLISFHFHPINEQVCYTHHHFIVCNHRLCIPYFHINHFIFVENRADVEKI
jgi:hypothetical protein